MELCLRLEVAESLEVAEVLLVSIKVALLVLMAASRKKIQSLGSTCAWMVLLPYAPTGLLLIHL